MPHIRLIGGPTSPFTRKVRIALDEKNIPFDFDMESPAGEDNRIIPYNPLGKVPVIVIDSERSIYDSRVIAEYLEMLVPTPALLPADGMARIAVRQWEALGDGICDACVACLWENRRAENRSQEFVDRQTRKFERGIAAASKELAGRDWYHGNAISQADITIGTALSYVAFRFAGNDWRTRYANLDALHSRLMQRRSFAGTEPNNA